MIASKKVERIENSAVKLTVTVPAADVRKQYDALLAEYSREVKMDGFRKGKVPAAVLERKFGDSLRLDAMGRVLEKSVEEAVADIPEKPLAYASPSLDGDPEFKLDADFTYTVTFDIFPEVSAPDWKGIEITVPQVTIAPEDEERELNQVRERNAIVVDKESGAKAAKGDVATVNYRELDEAGATIPGSEREDFAFEIGSGYNLYKFDDDIVGMKAGEEKTIAKTFPEDFEYEPLKGRSVKLAVTLTKLKAKQLPALDDDLAQDVSEKYKTLADLKADLRKQLEKRLEDKLRQIKEKAVVEGLLGRATVELPRSMVDAELSMRLENMMRQMGMDTPDKLDRILAYSGKTRQDLAEEWRPGAEKAIRTRLIIEKLVELEKIECSDADLEAEFARMSAESGLSVEEVKAEYEKRDGMDYLRHRVREDRLMDAIIAAGKVKKGEKMSFVDATADNQ
jgi:trigger factor